MDDVTVAPVTQVAKLFNDVLTIGCEFMFRCLRIKGLQVFPVQVLGAVLLDDGLRLCIRFSRLALLVLDTSKILMRLDVIYDSYTLHIRSI